MNSIRHSVSPPPAHNVSRFMAKILCLFLQLYGCIEVDFEQPIKPTNYKNIRLQGSERVKMALVLSLILIFITVFDYQGDLTVLKWTLLLKIKLIC